jgi:hypothetical protein
VLAVALKVAVVAPAATVTEAETGSRALLLDKATAVPPVGAGPLSVTVQFVLFDAANVVGVHAREVSVGTEVPGPVTTPPVPVTAMVLPEGEAATAFVIPMDVLMTPEAMVRFTTAMLPFEIVVAFMPDIRQVYPPELETQLRVLPALVAAGPALAEIAITLPAG